ncbi:ABC transporter substrate-binding protein [bacterium]|nr:ABC transporter substrate-binding protein [bacterium]
MKKLLSLTFILLMPIIGLCDTVKIGVIVPLTGNMTFVGEDVKNGFLLAQERKSDSQHNYQIIFEDNALDLKRTASAAQKLLHVDQVDVVVSLWPPAARVVAPMAERAKVLHYTIAWDPAIAEEYHYTLSHQSMVDSHVRETLNLLEKKKFKTAAFFQLNEAGFNIGTDVMLSEAENYGVEFIEKVIFDPSQKNFRSEITKAASKNPDVYLIWAVYPETEIIIKQLREQGINTPVTGFFDVVQNYELIEGTTFVSEISATEKFQKLYRERFKQEFKLKAPNAYDIFNLLVRSYETSPERKLDADSVITQLKSIENFPGAVGKISIDSSGNSEYPAVWHKVVNGKIKVLRR